MRIWRHWGFVIESFDDRPVVIEQYKEVISLAVPH
jgi:hypothetical protein